jgi:hypothetical protein
MRRFVTMAAVCALLASCTPRPDGSYDDRECRQITLSGVASDSRDPVGLILSPVFFGIMFVSCEAVSGLEVSWRYYHPVGPSDGFYLPPDRLFSVAIPTSPEHDGQFYKAQESIAPGQDSVLFTPPAPDEPVLAVVGLSDLKEPEASESVQAFAESIAPKLPGLTAPAATLQQVYDVNLHPHAGPAYLVVYRLVTPPGQEPTYQILYFVKDPDDDQRAAILSVTWPHDCPQCEKGPEEMIRARDPRIRNLVESFSFDTGHKL